jgi:hypothetical protein
MSLSPLSECIRPDIAKNVNVGERIIGVVLVTLDMDEVNATRVACS